MKKEEKQIPVLKPSPRLDEIARQMKRDKAIRAEEMRKLLIEKGIITEDYKTIFYL